MKNAYTLLGLLFVLVFGGAFILLTKDTGDDVTTDILLVQENYTMTMKITSPVFKEGAMIPKKYTCDGKNINPPLSIKNLPEGAQSLVLIMDDPDIPEVVKEKMGIEKFDHWVMYNIPALSGEALIPENYYNGGPDGGTDYEIIGLTGLNSNNETAYAAPCPPTEYEPTVHRYVFRLYALPDMLQFQETPTLDEVEKAATDIMLESSQLIGVYSRVKE